MSLTAQAPKEGDTVTVKRSRARLRASTGFTSNFIALFGDKAIVERVTGDTYLLRFNKLIIAATPEDIVATRTRSESPKPMRA